jgi:hypothetical protein
MMKDFKLSFVAAAILAGTAATATFAQDATAEKNPNVNYPTGYRDWTHLKSMLIFGEKHPLIGAFGGIHHVYANDKALKALKGKKDYPNGSVFAFDLLESPEAGGAYVEGKRKFVAVMERDAKKFAATEGWGWQVWEGGDPKKPAVMDISAARACATCHKEVGAKGFVFTEWRE